MKTEIREVHVKDWEPREWSMFDVGGNLLAVIKDKKLLELIGRADVVDNYIADTGRTESAKQIPGLNEVSKLLHYVSGMVTEAGEAMDALKKHLFYGKELDWDNLDEEVGDMLWYIARYLDLRKKNFPEVFAQNIRKLRARYPEKFTTEAALNRDLTKEFAALKGDA